MTTTTLLAVALIAACIAGPLMRRTGMRFADLGVGLFAGIVADSLGAVLFIEPMFTLILAIGLALGLCSLQQHASRTEELKN
jgi:hypothetical protein